MSALAKNSIIYLVSNIAVAVIPFLLLPIMTRYMSPHEYGQAASFQTFANMLGVLVGMNLATAVSVQAVKRSSGDLPVYVGTCLLMTGGVALVVAALLVALSPYMMETFAFPLRWVFYVVLFSLASSIFAHRLVLWQVAGRAVSYGLFNVCLAAVNMALSLGLVAGLGAGAEGRVFSITAATVTFGVLASVLLGKGGLIKLQWNTAAAKNALGISLPLVPYTLAYAAFGQADRFLIGAGSGLEQAGVYAVAMQFAAPIILVADAFNRACAPWMMRKLAADERDVVTTVSLLSVAVYCIGTVAYVSAATVLMPFVVGDRFVGASHLLWYLAPAIVAQASAYAVVNYVFYSERTAVMPVITCVAAVTYIGLGYGVVEAYGPSGLALTYSTISIAQTLAFFVLAQRVAPMPWLDIATYRRGLRALLERPPLAVRD